MPEGHLIAVKDLTVRFGEELVLDRVNLNVFRGEILVILGASGCGKTTLMRHMTGLDRPESGSIVIDGIDITSADDQFLKRALRKIGILFQGGALFGSMTIGENVALPITQYTGLGRKEIDEMVRLKLGMVDLCGYENHLPSEISGGMKKRAALARALALNPEILFLDEPSSGLDPVTSAEIDRLILNLNKQIKTTIVIVTHDLQSIFTVAKRAIMLDKNKRGIIAEGDPRQLRLSSDHTVVREFLNSGVYSGSNSRG